MKAEEKELTTSDKREIQERVVHLIRSHRNEQHLTQTDLASKLGVVTSLVTKFESRTDINNRIVSSFSFLFKIATAINMSVTELVSYLENDGAEIPDSPWNLCITNIFPKFKADLQCVLLKYFNKAELRDIESNLRFLVTDFIQLDQDSQRFIREAVTRVSGGK